MLLKHLYDFALSRDLLSDLSFSAKAVRWIIDLDVNGKFLGIVELNDDKRGKQFLCPQTTRAKNGGNIAEFLSDGIDSVFGLSAKPNEPKDLEKLQAKHSDFWRQIFAANDDVPPDASQMLSAVCTFNDSLPSPPSFFRQDGKIWKIMSASGIESVLKANDNNFFTFRVAGNLLLENTCIRDWWRKQRAIEIEKTKKNAELGLCVVTGLSDQPIARTHGIKIEGFPDSPPGGAALVSFEKSSKSFASYGFTEGMNCPTSEDAATAYCTALNHLIRSEDSSLRLGNTMLCFWAIQTKAAGSLFAGLLNKPDPQTVSKFMKSPWSGIDRELAKKDQFIAVTLKGCAGRIAISHWIHEPLEQAIENFEKWFTDLDIQVVPKTELRAAKNAGDKKTEFNPLSIYWLANAIPPLKRDKGSFKPDMDKLRSEVSTQLYRAALEGTAPSISLIKPILDQFRSRLLGDEYYKLINDQSRFALLKLILNRNRKENQMEIRPQLTADTDDPAYNCGRLLSVLSETQKKAHNYPKGFSGVAERYFGTASVSPSSVLPLLLRLNRHHMDKIRKSGGNTYQEKQKEDILARFEQPGEKRPPVFPRHLDLQAQGRFSLGFYQQQAEDARARIAAKVLNYLEEMDAVAHTEALALQDADPQSFFERVSQYCGSASFKEWSDKKQKKSKNASESDDPDLFDNE